jgi:hypothetical protein
MASTCYQMALFMKECGEKARCAGEEYLLGVTAQSTKGNGRTESASE